VGNCQFIIIGKSSHCSRSQGADDLGIRWKNSLRFTGWSHLRPPSYLMNDYVDTWCWGWSFVKGLYHMVRVILKLMQLPRIPISNLKPGPCSNFQPVHYLFISNLIMQCKDSCHYWSWIVNIELDYRDLVSIFTFQGLTSNFRCTVLMYFTAAHFKCGLIWQDFFQTHHDCTLGSLFRDKMQVLL
jgi:hypothetical protein